MSFRLQINLQVITVIFSALSTAGYVMWTESAKAADIDTAKSQIVTVQNEMKEMKKTEGTHSETLARLDERTAQILNLLLSKK